MKKSTVGILSSIVGAVIGAVAGVTASGTVTNKVVQQNGKRVDKFKSYYEVLNQWLMLKQEGKKIDTYFEKAGYRNIAIYGMGEVGNRLQKELEESEIKILYCLDKEAACLDADSNVIDMEDGLQGIDVVIVTAMFAFDEIEEDLMAKVDCPIISLEEVIFAI